MTENSNCDGAFGARNAMDALSRPMISSSRAPYAAGMPESSVPGSDGSYRVNRRSESLHWNPGEVIVGRYVVEEALEQDETGVTYGAFDSACGIKVFVKALPPELGCHAGEMEKIRESYRQVAGLRHPCIAGVRSLEFGECGQCFIVASAPEGETLSAWTRRRRKSGGVRLADTVEILQQVAGALDYAHAMKVVHCDVRPETS